MRVPLAIFAVAFFASAPASSQSVDAAVEVVNEIRLVGVTDVQLTSDYLGRDVESWKIVGACSNRPTERVRFIHDQVSLTAKRVRIVPPYSMSADRQVCITNPEKLDPVLRSKLNLND